MLVASLGWRGWVICKRHGVSSGGDENALRLIVVIAAEL